MRMSGQPSGGHDLLCSISQIPDRSGCPSMDRGAGALRFGEPLAVRGTPAVGKFNHCARAGAAITNEMVRAAASIFIFGNLGVKQLYKGITLPAAFRVPLPARFEYVHPRP